MFRTKETDNNAIQLDPLDRTDADDRITRIEPHGIDYIPDEERESKPSNLFYILVGGSITFSVIILGWFPIAFGLSWWAACSAVVVGAFLGALLLAPMGLMGPRSGTNNPVSSGALFGVVGRIIGTLLEASASLAFAALSIWTGGDALVAGMKALFNVSDHAVTRIVAYAVLSVIVTIVSVFGHHAMVAAQKFMLPTAGLALLIGVFVFLPKADFGYAGTGDYLLGSFWPTWLSAVLLNISTVTSYGAYVGDWTRHISKKRFSDRQVVGSLFFGGFFGLGGCILFGTFTSVAVLSSGLGDAYTPYVFGLVKAAPLWYVPLLIFLGLASGTAQAVINTYGTGLDTSSLIPKLNRVQATLAACGGATLLVYLGYFYTELMESVSVFLSLLVICSVPWIIIMIIGFIHRDGYYDVDDLQVFNRGERGGVYWFSHGLNWRALGVWATAVVVSFFFTNTAWYTGPGTELTNGADFGFIVGGVLTAVFYPLALRIWPEPRSVFAPEPNAGKVGTVGTSAE
ncbi:hypothetical protein BTO20_31670 [Mycobacterium dioxanotrophicus]|jgi:purine-cytosine permease-like protein|uniref:Nitrate reductase n=1 Tax=Mycobacterium dioxanotrophicus TaxID=482462 RepID=A0A1Y0CB71_9MYCO|nr:cytosine permease [Mycobacterium dioxanotrophicus]ART72510.1 hypothetical protein BTO20_31670 [Mycobacterium dioxanotrophicus]